MMPSGHKAFIVNNVKDVELLLMHNKTYAAEYAREPRPVPAASFGERRGGRGRTDICAIGSPTTFLPESESRSLPVRSN